MKIVKVEWIDSCSSNTAWSLLSEFDGDIEPIKIVSFGALIQENDETITLAQNFGLNLEQVSNLMTIPKCSIRDIRELKEE